MDIPRTIIWRSVGLHRISKPEINRPKLLKLLSTKYIQSNNDFYATEQNRAEGSTPFSYGHCERFDKLGGLQEETSKNDFRVSGKTGKQV